MSHYLMNLKCSQVRIPENFFFNAFLTCLEFEKHVIRQLKLSNIYLQEMCSLYSPGFFEKDDNDDNQPSWKTSFLELLLLGDFGGCHPN